MKTPDINALNAQKDELEAMWILTATNEGTYGAEEAVRKVGSGSPEFADCHIYARVGDKKTMVEGCDPEKAPGMIRYFHRELDRRRKEIAEINRQIKAIEEEK
jgi:hypothetical protein